MKDEAIKCMKNNTGDSKAEPSFLDQGKHNDWIPSYSMLLQQKYLYFHWAPMLWNKRICSKQRPTQKTHILKVTGEHMLYMSYHPCQGIFISQTAFSHACKHFAVESIYKNRSDIFPLGHSIPKSKMYIACSFSTDIHYTSFFSRVIPSSCIPPNENQIDGA